MVENHFLFLIQMSLILTQNFFFFFFFVIFCGSNGASFLDLNVTALKGQTITLLCFNSNMAVAMMNPTVRNYLKTKNF